MVEKSSSLMQVFRHPVSYSVCYCAMAFTIATRIVYLWCLFYLELQTGVRSGVSLSRSPGILLSPGKQFLSYSLYLGLPKCLGCYPVSVSPIAFITFLAKLSQAVSVCLVDGQSEDFIIFGICACSSLFNIVTNYCASSIYSCNFSPRFYAYLYTSIRTFFRFYRSQVKEGN